MDPFAPVQGISIEQFAELSAEGIDLWNDPERWAQVVAEKGIAPADWEAARAAWTARLQDVSLHGAVAVRYMPLYRAALARTLGLPPALGVEEYVGLAGAEKALGTDAMLRHYGIEAVRWTQILGPWGELAAGDAAKHAALVAMIEQEGERIQYGGTPRPAPGLAAQAEPPQAVAAVAAVHETPADSVDLATTSQNSGKAAHPQAQQQRPAAVQPQEAQGFERQVEHATAGAYGQAPNGAGAGIPTPQVGSQVLVAWSDGNRYPGTVMQLAQGHYLVTMGDGRQHWIPEAYVALG